MDFCHVPVCALACRLPGHLHNMPRRGGASRSAQHDVDLMRGAIVSKWNICPTHEYLAVYAH